MLVKREEKKSEKWWEMREKGVKERRDKNEGTERKECKLNRVGKRSLWSREKGGRGDADAFRPSREPLEIVVPGVMYKHICNTQLAALCNIFISEEPFFADFFTVNPSPQLPTRSLSSAMRKPFSFPPNFL
jgi:hypothetical protein